MIVRTQTPEMEFVRSVTLRETIYIKKNDDYSKEPGTFQIIQKNVAPILFCIILLYTNQMEKP